MLYQDELASRGIWKGQKMSDNRRVVLQEKISELQKILDEISE